MMELKKCDWWCWVSCCIPLNPRVSSTSIYVPQQCVTCWKFSRNPGNPLLSSEWKWKRILVAPGWNSATPGQTRAQDQMINKNQHRMRKTMFRCHIFRFKSITKLHWERLFFIQCCFLAILSSGCKFFNDHVVWWYKAREKKTNMENNWKRILLSVKKRL